MLTGKISYTIKVLIKKNIQKIFINKIENMIVLPRDFAEYPAIKIMDMKIGNEIGFCGCPNVSLESSKNRNSTLVKKGSNLIGIIKNVKPNQLEINYLSRKIIMIKEEKVNKTRKIKY